MPHHQILQKQGIGRAIRQKHDISQQVVQFAFMQIWGNQTHSVLRRKYGKKAEVDQIMQGLDWKSAADLKTW